MFITYEFIICSKYVRGMSEMKKKYEQFCSYLKEQEHMKLLRN